MGGITCALEPRTRIENRKSKMKKAILLAGGAGTRLFPLTKIVCKQLLPIYDKPMICYPLATLMLGGLREVLIISTPKDLPMLRDYLNDGEHLGIRIEYAEQPKPEGIAQAFLIAAKFIEGCGVSLSRGVAWLDTGTTTTLLEAGNYIATIEHRQGLKVACLEEVALRAGFITESQLAATIDRLPKGEYRDYLRIVCDEGPSAGPDPVG